MAYGKICGTLVNHPKTRKAGNEAMGAWVRMLSWCCEYMTDGLIPEDMALEIAGRREVVERLVELSFIERVNDGLQFHDYADHNITRAQWEEKRAQRVSAGKNSAASRSRSTTRSTTAPTNVQAPVEQSQSQSQSEISPTEISGRTSGNGRKAKKKPALVADPQILEAWEYYAGWYRQIFPQRNPVLDDKNARIIRDRLKDGCSVEQLKLAVQGMFGDPFYLGSSDRNKTPFERDGNFSGFFRNHNNHRVCLFGQA